MLKKQLIKRSFDLTIAFVMLVLSLVPMLLVSIIVRTTSKGSILYWSDRVGRYNVIFSMPKFRTMLTNAPEIASHLMSNPEKYLYPFGDYLRHTSLDELPQLWCILKGEMSFVGPRPALFNQDDLILLRKEKGVDQLLPGLTGWAQVNGRDELPIHEKVLLDVEYKEKQSFWFDLHIVWLTVLKVFRKDGISH